MPRLGRCSEGISFYYTFSATFLCLRNMLDLNCEMGFMSIVRSHLAYGQSEAQQLKKPGLINLGLQVTRLRENYKIIAFLIIVDLIQDLHQKSQPLRMLPTVFFFFFRLQHLQSLVSGIVLLLF